jgi:hypothetical protein
VVQHLQRRTLSIVERSGSAGRRSVRHMIASHAQTTALPSRDHRSSHRGKFVVLLSPPRAAERATTSGSSVGAFQVGTVVHLLAPARCHDKPDNRSAVRIGRQDLLAPVPVARPYRREHSMRGLILRPGGTTPIHLRGRPHALLPLHAGARLVVRTLAAGRVGRRRGHESQTMALVVIGGVTCVGQQ